MPNPMYRTICSGYRFSGGMGGRAARNERVPHRLLQDIGGGIPVFIIAREIALKQTGAGNLPGRAPCAEACPFLERMDGFFTTGDS